MREINPSFFFFWIYFYVTRRIPPRPTSLWLRYTSFRTFEIIGLGGLSLASLKNLYLRHIPSAAYALSVIETRFFTVSLIKEIDQTRVIYINLLVLFIRLFIYLEQVIIRA